MLVLYRPRKIKMPPKSGLVECGNALQMKSKCVALNRKTALKTELEIAKAKLAAEFSFPAAPQGSAQLTSLKHPTDSAAEMITNDILIAFRIVTYSKRVNI